MIVLRIKHMLSNINTKSLIMSEGYTYGNSLNAELKYERKRTLNQNAYPDLQAKDVCEDPNLVKP